MVLSYAVCGVCVATMRKEANHRAASVSQLLFGERLEIIDIKDDYWALVRGFADDYEGWCLLGQLNIISKKAFQKEAKYIVNAQGAKLFSDSFEMPLFAGSMLRTGSIIAQNERQKFKGRKIEILSLEASAENVKKIAVSFLNTPYLWAGRTLQGIDCSGLSQIVLRLNGVQIARDASQQALQGDTISFLQESRCGDLAFFANAEGKINHVGIILDEQHIIHATETSGVVVIDKIDQEGIVSLALRKRTHTLRLIKRYF